MSDCFPPIPLYIAAGIVAAMFTTVASKIDGRAEALSIGDIGFAAFLLLILAIPFTQLVLVLMTTVVSGNGAGSCVLSAFESDAWWILVFHIVTLAPLFVGAVVWFWKRSTIGLRLRRPRMENAIMFSAAT